MALFIPVKKAPCLLSKTIWPTGTWLTRVRHNSRLIERHHNTQHNDIQHNDTQHNDSQHNDTQHDDTQHNDTLHNDIQHTKR